MRAGRYISKWISFEPDTGLACEQRNRRSIQRYTMSHYEVRGDDCQKEDDAFLERYYGTTWRSILDRFNHRFDGYLFTLHENNQPFNIYRIIDQQS